MNKPHDYKIKRNNISCLLVSLVLLSCSTTPQPQPEPAMPAEFSMALVQEYGPYYQKGGLAQNVVSLDLYSDGLSFDSLGLIQGSGTNLYFSDIFLPSESASLQEGIYACDTLASPMTFLPGMNFEGSFTGAYLLYIEDSKLTSILLIEGGEMEVTEKNDSTYIDFRLRYKENYRQYDYTAHFSGKLTNK